MRCHAVRASVVALGASWMAEEPPRSLACRQAACSLGSSGVLLERCGRCERASDDEEDMRLPRLRLLSRQPLLAVLRALELLAERKSDLSSGWSRTREPVKVKRLAGTCSRLFWSASQANNCFLIASCQHRHS